MADDNLDEAILRVLDEKWLGGGATTVDIHRELNQLTKEQVRRRLASMVRRGVLTSADGMDYQYSHKTESWRWTRCKIYSRPEER